VLDLAKENGTVLLSFPQHTTHKLNPLDKSNTSGEWLRIHREKNWIIYNIPSVVNQSLPNALTSKTLRSGISVTGIWSFNADMFTDEDL
jgi:hypothetical protein